ncbi:hypothetical protein LWI29_026148 [Acer saccharum]|uniref:Uncharacterized protein n=1 Tax=Acer saccharum TaxID=4024 RepID=A0AA39SXS8_ACESA|nr:hypothetical protein LWI29_026148 [Acer saccharum]
MLTESTMFIPRESTGTTTTTTTMVDEVYEFSDEEICKAKLWFDSALAYAPSQIEGYGLSFHSGTIIPALLSDVGGDNMEFLWRWRRQNLCFLVALEEAKPLFLHFNGGRADQRREEKDDGRGEKME